MFLFIYWNTITLKPMYKQFFQHIYTIFKKEIKQIKRDNRTLALLLFFPSILLFLWSYTMNFDVKDIKVALYDKDNSKLSREFANSFFTSGYFLHEMTIFTNKEVDNSLTEGKVKMVLIIPEKFSNKLESKQNVDIQILVDGVDANYATTVVGFSQAVTQQFNQKIFIKSIAKFGKELNLPINYETRIWYNPELRSDKFLVSGVVGFIIAITCIIATSLSIVKEIEFNTIEQIDVSPITSLELIIGKLIPYAIIGVIATAIVLLFAYISFGVEIKGSYLLLFVATILFTIACLGIGLFISTITNNQESAFQIAALVSMLPTFILSGFIFPISSMPYWLQIISNITPAKFYLKIIRAIMLKGSGIEAFWEQFVYLSIFSIVLIGISSIKFSNRLSKQ